MITTLIVIAYIILGLITTKLVFHLTDKYDYKDPEDTLGALFVLILWPLVLSVCIIMIASSALFKRIL